MNLEGRKIVWIEDDPFLSSLIAKKLSIVGAKMINYKSGKEALAAMEKDTPDVVILDLVLTGESGFDVLQNIKKMPALKAVPVILLSNLAEESDQKKGLELGAEKFLIKSNLSLDQIISEIQNCCKVSI